MKFAFFYHTLTLCERNFPDAAFDTVEIDGATYELAAIPGNVFLRDGKVRHKSDQYCNSTFLKIGGYFVYQHGSWSMEEFKERLSMARDQLPSYVKDRLEDIADPEAYNRRKEKDIADKKERFEKEKKEREARKAEQEKERAEKLNAAREKYKNGEKIEWSYFEELCDEQNISIPIKTKGWGRKSVFEISSSQYSFSGNGSTSIGAIMKQLYSALNV